MKTKWYWSTFIVILALIGFTLQQFAVPNQEIVVQFSHDKVTQLESKNTIAVVKNQLQSLGVKNIQVLKGENGNLKITYYSDLEVAFIQHYLSNTESLEVSFASIFKDKNSPILPEDSSSNPFQLKVLELKQGQDKNGDFNSFALELKPEIDRFYKTVVYLPFVSTEENTKNNTAKVAYKIQNNIAIAIDHITYKIPEVRAGPLQF